MKKLVLKLLLLTGITTGISAFVVNVCLPVFWGHPDGQVKLHYLETNTDSVNTLFIGSSRILHHVIPEEFDSLCGLNGVYVNSFNLGLRQFNMPQSFLMVNKVLEETNNLDYVFIEVTPIIYDLPGKKTNSPRYYYWYDFTQASLLSEHVDHVGSLDTLSGWEKKKRYDMEFYLNLGRKNLFVGGPQSMLLSALDGETGWIYENCARNRGFNPIDLEQGPFVTLFASQRAGFLKDTTILDERKNLARNFGPGTGKPEYTPYANTLVEILAAMKKKGTTVYFIVTPSLANYAEVTKLLVNIPKENIINLSSPDEYPDLYQSEYFFDRTHMNRKGAQVFTAHLAQRFTEQLKQ